jgi:hypothetical protein
MAFAEVVERFGQWSRLAFLELIVALPQSGDRFLELAVTADAHQVAKNGDRHQQTFAVCVLDLDATAMRINGPPLFFGQSWSHAGKCSTPSDVGRDSFERAILEGLRRLRFLILENMPITDAGLPHLEGLTKLEFVSLNGTKVTRAGIAKLRRVLPGTKIVGP